MILHLGPQDLMFIQGVAVTILGIFKIWATMGPCGPPQDMIQARFGVAVFIMTIQKYAGIIARRTLPFQSGVLKTKERLTVEATVVHLLIFY